MPLYEFYNEEIDERYELMMTYDNKNKYLKKNPHIKEIIKHLTSLVAQAIESKQMMVSKKYCLR